MPVVDFSEYDNFEYCTTQEGRRFLRDMLREYIRVENRKCHYIAGQLLDPNEFKDGKAFLKAQNSLRARLQRWLGPDQDELFPNQEQQNIKACRELEELLGNSASVGDFLNEHRRRGRLETKGQVLADVFLGNTTRQKRLNMRANLRPDLEGIHRIYTVGISRFLEDDMSAYVAKPSNVYYYFYHPEDFDYCLVQIFIPSSDEKEVVERYSGFAFTQENHLDLILGDSTHSEIRIHQTIEITGVLDAHKIDHAFSGDMLSSHGAAYGLNFLMKNLHYDTEGVFERRLSRFFNHDEERNAALVTSFDPSESNDDGTFILFKEGESTTLNQKLLERIYSGKWNIMI